MQELRETAFVMPVFIVLIIDNDKGSSDGGGGAAYSAKMYYLQSLGRANHHCNAKQISLT